jgi:hypothetical protein
MRCALRSGKALNEITRKPGSKFNAVNNRDKNYTLRKITARVAQVEKSITP